jgi:hypothetical protein
MEGIVGTGERLPPLAQLDRGKEIYTFLCLERREAAAAARPAEFQRRIAERCWINLTGRGFADKH